MHAWSLFYLRKFFSKKPDTKVISFGYHSTLYSEKVLERLEKVVNEIPASHEIFFVGHSMGGLVAKNYLCKKTPDINATLITLGTPHQGSRVGERVINSPLRLLMGKSGDSGIKKKSWNWNKKYKLICIAGTGNFGPGKLILPQEKTIGDGTVFLDEAIDEENADKKIILDKMNHTQMIASPRVLSVLEEIIYN